MIDILFVNHREKRCGVYQFGLNTYNIIKNSKLLNVVYIEANQLIDVLYNMGDIKYLLFNYHPTPFSWLTGKMLTDLMNKDKTILSIFHEVPITGFQYYLHPDPTFFETSYRFRVGRPIQFYTGEYPKNDILTVGSFGFGFENKGWYSIINRVQKEFDNAVIRFNIPPAKFGDDNGEGARKIERISKTLIHKPGIKLEVDYNFYDTNDVLKFLAGNDLNAFFYEEMYGRGISSTLDYALGVKRPLALTKSMMFKHLNGIDGVFVEDNTLEHILKSGTKPLETFYQKFSNKNLIKDYERIFLKLEKGR